MRRFRVYPYKQGSKSAKMLSLALGGKVLKRVNSLYNPKPEDVVINWGSSSVPLFEPATILNKSVEIAQCKLKTFATLKDENVVRVPPFTDDFMEAKSWIQGGGKTVVCRTALRGHSGQGIVIADTADELVLAPLYTEYVKKKHEYRVHVSKTPHIPGLGLGGYNTFFVQRKALKQGVENPDWKIRNLAGGFVFVDTPIEEVPADVILQAENAVESLRLDFGGVDVVYNEASGCAYVLEVNTACGLEERTAEKYANAIFSMC